MAVDAYTVIAAARRRGVPEAAIARQLGLKDGQSGYGVMRQDPSHVVVVPGDAKSTEKPRVVHWPSKGRR